MFCPQCKSEYRFGFTRCSDCGLVLVDRMPADIPAVTPKGDAQAEFVIVRSYANEFDADLDKTVLDTAGIESTVTSHDTGGGSPALGWRRIDLLVTSEDAKEASDLLNAVLS
jgi:hypothetical protein